MLGGALAVVALDLVGSARLGGNVFALVSLVILAAAGAPVDPSGKEQSAEGSDEIVVTGERTSRSLRETPSSVEVFAADMLENQPGADRLDQILEQVPNVQLGSGGQGPTIRGQDTTGVLQDLPAFLGGTKPRVTLQVDGRSVGFNEFIFGVAPLWDVQQIEIFRSPQTTTQGRNSIAGAIFISTKDPTYRPELSGRLIVGSRSLYQVSAAASGPVVRDQLAFRLSGDLRRGRPASKITDTMPGGDPTRDDYTSLRFKLLAEPTFLPGSRFEASYARSEADAPQIEGIRAPFRERRDPLATYGVFATRVDAFTFQADIPIAADLSSTSTITHGRSRIQRFAPVGLGQTESRVRDWSIESIVRWRPDDAPVQAHGGVHYLQARLDQFINLSAVIGTGDFLDRQRSVGLFGEASIHASPRLSVTAGVRFQRDRQDREGQLGTAALIFPIDFDRSFEAWLPKLSVAYEFADALSAGVLVQRGYNPGGTTLNFDTGAQETFGRETLWSYEVFARGSFADDRLSWSANLFHTAFRDSQRARTRAYSVPGGRTAFWAEIRNVPKSESQGLEVSADWKISGRFQVRGGLGLLKTRIIDAGNADPTIAGNEFQRAPALSFSASADWRPVDRFRLNASLRHHSGYFSDDANTPARRIEPGTELDARAAFDTGPITLFGYVRNLLDDLNLKYLFSPTVATATKPREFGIGLEARF